MDKIEALEKVGKKLLLGQQEAAKILINEQYPFRMWKQQEGHIRINRKGSNLKRMVLLTGIVGKNW